MAIFDIVALRARYFEILVVSVGSKCMPRITKSVKAVIVAVRRVAVARCGCNDVPLSAKRLWTFLVGAAVSLRSLHGKAHGAVARVHGGRAVACIVQSQSDTYKSSQITCTAEIDDTPPLIAAPRLDTVLSRSVTDTHGRCLRPSDRTKSPTKGPHLQTRLHEQMMVTFPAPSRRSCPVRVGRVRRVTDARYAIDHTLRFCRVPLS